MEHRQKLKHINRIVIKIGTSLLTGTTIRREDFLRELVREIKWLKDRNVEVILVSSGAIGLGIEELGLKKRPSKLPLEQATASVGQGLLMEIYRALFKKAGITVAQVLLTRDDFRSRRRYLNAANTLYALLEHGVVPIVNENDAVAIDELHYGNKFGDNDILAALLTNLLRAGLLVLLTDVEGLCAGVSGEIIGEVKKITPEIERIALGTNSDTSRGGMSSKIRAGHLVISSGGIMIIASGFRKNVLREIVEGEDTGTIFIPPEKKFSGRKLWLAFSHTPHGEVIVDDGAKAALMQKGRSLLPVGVERVRGSFQKGDLVSVSDTRGRELARGLVNFSSEEVEKIRGLKSSEIQDVLGSRPYEEVIHRNNMVIL